MTAALSVLRQRALNSLVSRLSRNIPTEPPDPSHQDYG